MFPWVLEVQIERIHKKCHFLKFRFAMNRPIPPTKESVRELKELLNQPNEFVFPGNLNQSASILP